MITALLVVVGGQAFGDHVDVGPEATCVCTGMTLGWIRKGA